MATPRPAALPRTSTATAEEEEEADLRYAKVVHDGGVIVRCAPRLDAEPILKTAGEDGAADKEAEGGEQLVLPHDAIVRVGLSVKQDTGTEFFELETRGQWVLAMKPGLVAVRIVPGPLDIAGEWMYRVVHPEGACFAREPHVESERYSRPIAKGTLVLGVRKLRQAGSQITAVQLSNNRGWLFEHASKGGECLDRFKRAPLVESVPNERRISGEHVWCRVVAANHGLIASQNTPAAVTSGVQLRQRPSLFANGTGEVLLPSKIVECEELLWPVGELLLCFGKVVDERGWLLLTDAEGHKFAEQVQSPIDRRGEHLCCYRVMFPGGVAVRCAPFLDAPKLPLVVCMGQFVVVNRVFRRAGQQNIFVHIEDMASLLPLGEADAHHLPGGGTQSRDEQAADASEEGAGADAGGDEARTNNPDANANPASAKPMGSPKRPGQGKAQVPGPGFWLFERDQGGSRILLQEQEGFPEVRSGDLYVQILFPGGIRFRHGAHPQAVAFPSVAPPYAVVEVDQFVVSPNGDEAWARRAGCRTNAQMWLPCRLGGQDVAELVEGPPEIQLGEFRLRVLRSNCAVPRHGPHETAPALQYEATSAERPHGDEVPPLEAGTELRCDRRVFPASASTDSPGVRNFVRIAEGPFVGAWVSCTDASAAEVAVLTTPAVVEEITDSEPFPVVSEESAGREGRGSQSAKAQQTLSELDLDLNEV